MAATRVNYLVFYVNQSQVFGASSREIALASPPPKESSLEDKRVLFITYQPDNEILSVHQLSQEEVMQAELKVREHGKA